MKKFLTFTFVLLTLLTLSACKHKHDYSEWTTSKEATCQTQGEETRSCKECGEVETKKTEVLNHNYTQVTCTEDKVCTMCDEIAEVALGHEYSEGVCARCGHVSAYTTIVQFIIENGEFDDDDCYWYTIYFSETDADNSAEIVLDYDASDNYLSLAIYKVNETKHYNLYIDFNEELNGRYDWDYNDSDCRCYGKLDASTFTADTILKHSHTDANDSITTSSKQQAVIMLADALAKLESKLSPYGFTAKSFGFNSIK